MLQRIILTISFIFGVSAVQSVLAATLTDTYLADLRPFVLEHMNASRAENGLSPLTYSTNIERVAQGHVDDTAEHFDPTNIQTREATYLAHTSSNGRALNARYRDAEVETGWEFAENVGYWIREPFGDTLEASRLGLNLIHKGMMVEVPPNDSHRKNILGNYTHVGIGFALANEDGGASVDQRNRALHCSSDS